MSGNAMLPASVPGGGPRQSMSLPHNIHPSQMATDQTGNRWKRFQPLKKLQRMFRRKSKTKDEDGYPDAPKSFSASHLLPDQQRRTSERDSPPIQSRLSMSHDSIFQSDSQTQDDLGSTLSIPGASRQLNAELRGVLLKRRGDDSDDDPGLPHSPATPPTVSTRLQKELKGQSGKSGGSCSDGSLLSMYSSGTCTDEDIFGPISTHHSRASLARDQDTLDLETSGALSHSAAKHRIAVRPRRNHGAPRQHRRQRPQPSPAPTGLPPTVEEESPPVSPGTAANASQEQSGANPAAAADGAPAVTVGSASPRLPAVERARRTPSVSPSRKQSLRTGSPDGASSVPPRPTPVKRSKSSVADRRLRDLSPRKLWSRDSASPGVAPALDCDERKTEGFFSRIFGSRRSGRGKRKDGSSLSPESSVEDAAAAARPPVVPRSSHRQRPPRARSPPSALHADIIRPPPSSAAAADVIRPMTSLAAGDVIRPPACSATADVIRPSASSAANDVTRPVTTSADSSWQSSSTTTTTITDIPASRGPPEALLRRNGPAFLADVRAEVRALASGGDRGDESSGPVSPQFVRRQRASAAAAPAARGSESPRVRPRLVGLTSYQQRVAQMQGGSSRTPERETKRRSFSCENISEDGGRRDSVCSGMALGSVLSLIKATAAQEPEESKRSDCDSPKGEEEPVVAGFGVALKSVRRDSSGSPGAGPKSLDSSLRCPVSESAPAAAPQKASSAESVPSSDPPARPPQDRRSTSESEPVSVPEFLKVHLQVVEGRQAAVSDPVPAPRQKDASSPVVSATSGDGWRASVRSSAAATSAVPLYSPSCEKRSSVAAREPETARRESEESETTTGSEASRSASAAAESPPVLRRPVPAAKQSSPEAVRRTSQVARAVKPAPEPTTAESVPLRNKPPSSEDSELLKVFKRRSLRTRDVEDIPQKPASTVIDEKGAEQPREETEETVSSVSRELAADACRQSNTGDASPTKLRRAEFLRSARLSSPASPTEPAPPSRPGSDARSVTSEGRPMSATSSDSEGTPRRVSVARRESENRRISQTEEEVSSSPTNRAGWLKQTVRERREQREQREMKHLRPAHTAANNHKELHVEPESVAPGRVAGTRSSRVLQMANTFQKLQTT